MLNSKYSEDNTDIRRRLNLVLFSFVFFLFFIQFNTKFKGFKKLLSVNSVKVVYTSDSSRRNIHCRKRIEYSDVIPCPVELGFICMKTV